MEKGFVKSNIENGICNITFFHPSSNSLPSEILNQLAIQIEEAGKNEIIKVILLQSEGGGAFCAGASFDELQAIKNETEGKQFFSGFAHVINAIRKAPKFVVGRIHGKAVGGGVGLASACDYAIATNNAAVKLSELAVGIGPFVVGPAVERKIGTSAFMQLSINATEWKDAQWACQQGLYTTVYQSTDEMDIALNKLLNTLSTSNPEAMAMLKKIMWQGTEHWNELLLERAAMSGKLVLSDFTRNAIHKFKQVK